MPKQLFDKSDEDNFKKAFACQFMASIEAVNYQDNCFRGWKGHKYCTEDAVYLAGQAWAQMVEEGLVEGAQTEDGVAR